MSARAPRAADVMTSPVQSVTDAMDVREAMTRFEQLGVSGAPVVDDEGRLVGVLSQTDIVHYYLGRDDELTVETDFYHRPSGSVVPGGFNVMDTNTPSVRELMSPVCIAATEDTPVSELARTMIERKVHRVVITSHGDEVVGIVSALDLLRALVDD